MSVTFETMTFLGNNLTRERQIYASLSAKALTPLLLGIIFEEKIDYEMG